MKPIVIILLLSSSLCAADFQVGVAMIDITPDYPVRLNGFAHRKTESEGVTRKIYAKAIAIGDGASGPAVLMAVDSLGVPDYMTIDVAKRLKQKANVEPDRLAITSTHTHTAPMLTNCCPTIFGRPLTAAEQEHVDRYTKELADKLEQVAMAAIGDLKPGKLEYATGSVGFAINRRTKGGPVDHDMPLLTVRDADGKLRAVLLSYACHCVTLSHNKISGDWAGYAAEMIEKEHPGAVALTAIGCGADSNPSSNPVGDRVDIAQGQGKQIADEVERLLKQGLQPITKPLGAKINRIVLPFDTPPTREQWEAVAKQQDSAGYHARINLARLERGEKLQTELLYPVQTWTFGDELGMVFLAGEVVVDYSLRLKREFDRSRLWVNAYSNDVPCYIPSERILKEGGYEGIGAMLYYDRPTKLATGIEQKIIDEVHKQLPDEFDAPKGTEGVAPRSPAQSLRSMRTKPGLKVELVAAEPLITSPVAIDWGEDGRLWVCEMVDYPTGTDQNFQPGGRIKFLTDTNGDGQYDKATVFLENLPFPTGVTAWGNGVLVCAAPDILYAIDSDGDGKADKVEKLFSGFATENYQARVNSLSLGLDNWIYGGNGLLGGMITGASTKLDIRNHDFRFRPVNGPMETVTGLTQYGRVRDDWGNWFGCDNSRSLLHYLYEERYLRRNPRAPAPSVIVAPPADYDVSRVYPISRTLERFNDPSNANRFTSGCGLGIYRDTLLGEEYAGNAFTCEPVHNLVHRMVLEGEGSGLKRHRAKDEDASEFLASSDNWSRPVQVRTGPDGALYVVDMYRFLIEHPRWIPAERLAKLDIRAGADKGRIYRILPENQSLRRVTDLTQLSAAELAAAINSPNGTERDRVHVALLLRRDKAAARPLATLAASAKLAAVRVQALAALDGLGALSEIVVEQALHDGDQHVRAHAVRLMEASPGEGLLSLVDDPSPLVRRQLAFSLGEWSDRRAGAALAAMAKRSLADADMRIAILSAASRHCGDILAAVMSMPEDAAGRSEWVVPLVAMAAASKDEALVSRALAAVLPADGATAGTLHFASLASLLDARPELRNSDPRVSQVIAAAKAVAADEGVKEDIRITAVSLLSRSALSAEELEVLVRCVAEAKSDKLRGAALAALRRQTSADVAANLLAQWKQISPSLRPDIVNLLSGRDEWAMALLEAAKKRSIQPNEISLAERARLSGSANAEIKKLAAEVFASQPISASRSEVLNRYVSVKSLTGSSGAGKELFVKNCAACHEVNGVGHDVGASLAALRGRDADYFVKNILDPSAVIEPRFVNYVIALKDGRTLSGVIKAESSAGITLASGSGGATAASIETIGRSDIKEIRATTISMMPDGFEAALSPQQLADLIAFVKSGAPQRKQLAGNTPTTLAAAEGLFLLPATTAEIYGEQIVLEDQFKNVGYWSGGGDYVVWRLRVDKAGDYDVHIDYACAQDSAGNGFAIEAGGQTITGVIAATGPDWDNYKQLKVGTLRLEAGEQQLLFRPDGALRSALVDLRAVALAPPGTQPKWPNAATGPTSDDLPRNAAAIAKYILDPARSGAAREAAVNANPQYAAELIVEMTRDLPSGAEEYKRIPWIWRIAIAAGKRNDAAMIVRILDVSLPKDDEPLRDWQAVVIGGGIINGISQRNLWPAQRIAEMLGDNDVLNKRWKRSLDLASEMADNQKVPSGTRYDALRMLGVRPWEQSGEQLARYLAKETNAELQMGAVSGLADVDSPQATAALIGALTDLTEGNRNLALDALLRGDARPLALLDAVASRTVDPGMLGENRIRALKSHPASNVRQRASAVLQ